VVHCEHVHPAIFPDDALAERDLPIHREPALAVAAREVGGDAARVLGAGHRQAPCKASSSCGSRRPPPTTPSTPPACKSRVRAVSSATGDKSLPRNERPL